MVMADAHRKARESASYETCVRIGQDAHPCCPTRAGSHHPGATEYHLHTHQADLQHHCIASPAAQRSSPAAQRSSPAAQRPSPAAQRSSPAAQRSPLATQRSSPATQRSSPAAQRSSPAAQSCFPSMKSDIRHQDMHSCDARKQWVPDSTPLQLGLEA